MLGRYKRRCRYLERHPPRASGAKYESRLVLTITGVDMALTVARIRFSSILFEDIV